MDVLLSILKIVAILTGGLAVVFSFLLFVRLHWPSPALYFLKLLASALSPVFLFVGVFCILAGLISGAAFIVITGLYVVLINANHLYRVTRPPDPATGFQQAFGKNWEDNLKQTRKDYFLSGRTIFYWSPVPQQRMRQNLAFANIPGTNQQLLCDLWQPPENVTPSGLAFIYLHGGAWYMLDKDFGTRPFFSHLAAQGHVIMDVAYRLAPETNMMGMIHDTKRAIVWMKENAAAYGIDPDQIVVGGGSAGGHLTLMAAYTAGDDTFTPDECKGKDDRVCAVISLYGPADVEAVYYHTNQHLTTRAVAGKPGEGGSVQMPSWMSKGMGADFHRFGFDKNFVEAGTLASMFSCHPDECPEIYARFSPVTHVHAKCPPTLLIQGEHDVITPVSIARELHLRLVEEGVPGILHLIPQTDHGFDLILPRISPSAHNAVYDVERFLAFMVGRNKLFSNEFNRIPGDQALVHALE